LENLGEVNVAVVDILLPDGMELVREMREANPNMPVVALTMVGDPEVSDWALDMGQMR